MCAQFYKGSSEERLMDLINRDNQSEYELGIEFNFGTLTSVIRPDGRNTQLDLIATPQYGYANDLITYTRLPINVLEDLPEDELKAVIIPNLPTSIHELLPEINTSLGLDLTENEVLNLEITQKEPNYELRIVEGSYAWLPSSFLFKAYHSDELVSLENLITQKELLDFTISDVEGLSDIDFFLFLVNNTQDPATGLTPDDVEVVDVDMNAGSGVGNSRARLEAKKLPLIDSIEVTYNRIDISDIIPNTDNEFVLPIGATLEDLIIELNIRYSSSLSVDDFEETLLPESIDLEIVLDLTTKEDSLIYYGSAEVVLSFY